MGKKRGYELNRRWYCTKCGNQIPYVIPRAKGKERPVSHLKRLWCLNCQEERNTVETEEGTKYSREDFLMEFNYHNFDEQGNRIMPYGLFRAKIHNEGVELP